MTHKNETLVSQNLASELINQTGEYKQYKKTYTLVDKTISQKIMLEMFKFSGVFKPSFIVEYIAEVSFSMMDLVIMDRVNSDHNIPRLEQSITRINKDDDTGYENIIYKKPIFSRNLAEVTFVDKNYNHNYLNRFCFRFISRSHRPLDVLNNSCNALENETLTFNEALFLLLGFNTVLAPDYEIINSTHPIDKAMLRTEQGQKLNAKRFNAYKIDTKDFLNWAALNGFIKEKTTNKLEAEKKERIEIVKEMLIPYLEDTNRPTTVNALSQNPKFLACLSQKGLVIIQNDEDTSNQTTDTYTPKTLGEYLTDIVNSLWWKEQHKAITKMLTYKAKIKK